MLNNLQQRYVEERSYSKNGQMLLVYKAPICNWDLQNIILIMPFLCVFRDMLILVFSDRNCNELLYPL